MAYLQKCGEFKVLEIFFKEMERGSSYIYDIGKVGGYGVKERFWVIKANRKRVAPRIRRTYKFIERTRN